MWLKFPGKKTWYNLDHVIGLEDHEHEIKFIFVDNEWMTITDPETMEKVRQYIIKHSI